MITGLLGSYDIKISNGNPNLPYVNESNTPTIDSTGRSHYNGDIRYLNGGIQIFNSGSWINMGTYASVDLSQEIKDILSWVKYKIDQEQKIKKMAEKYPAVKTAKDQLDIVMALVEEYR